MYVCIYTYTYLYLYWLCWVFEDELSLAGASGGYSLVVEHRLLIAVASTVVEHGFWSTWASAVVVHGLVATESSQTRGWTHVPRIGRRILTTGPPGKSKLTTVLNEHLWGNFPSHQKIWAVLSSSITNTILEKTIKVRYERHLAQRILWGCPNRFCTISSLCVLWICTSNCVFILGVSQIISLQLKMA